MVAIIEVYAPRALTYMSFSLVKACSSAHNMDAPILIKGASAVVSYCCRCGTVGDLILHVGRVSAESFGFFVFKTVVYLFASSYTSVTSPIADEHHLFLYFSAAVYVCVLNILGGRIRLFLNTLSRGFQANAVQSVWILFGTPLNARKDYVA